MEATEIYEKETGKKQPNNVYEHSEWFVDYVKWLEDHLIRQHETEQTKPNFTDFGGFDPDRPWEYLWSKFRAVDADGEEWEFEDDNYDKAERNCSVWTFGDYGMIKRVRTHDMTGKDWTKSKQERNR